MLEVVGDAFLEVLAEQAVRRINEMNPRKQIYSQPLTWLKKQWEIIWEQ